MFAIKSATVLFSMIISVFYCQRRIKDGLEVTKNRNYVVYLVQAPLSESGYDYWLCGGAIVQADFVLTSAACVDDVDYLYVVSGYNKHVVDDQIEIDECTKEMKKKAVYTCSPKGYELKYGEIDYWSYVDIALIKVDTPFNFNDDRYETLCSYKPGLIPINYEEKYQAPGTDALVLGWGHEKQWRMPGDNKDYNSPTLKYGSTLLLNKTHCIEHFEDYTNMSKVINTYMICSLGTGNINDAGKTVYKSLPLQNGCTSQQEKLLGFEGISCEQRSSEESYDDDQTRRQNRGSNKTNNVSVSDFDKTQSRRTGICQNDHGGPLVTWAGAQEILIGIASVFKVSEDHECMGPYLYTSTYCTGMFLECLLNTELPFRRSYLCDSPASERGYDIIERTISWTDFPARPAKNENIGRMPKEKISSGLKYLTNNQPSQQSNAKNVMNLENAKYRKETKYESNNMFLSNKNPAIINNAENKRVSGQENDPVSNGHQDELKFGSNKMYVATKSPAIVSYAHKGRFKIKERESENKTISGMESFPVNDKFPSNQMPSVNQRHPVNQRYPIAGRYPVIGRYSVTGTNPVTESYQVTERNPVSVGLLENRMKFPSKVVLRSQHPLRN